MSPLPVLVLASASPRRAELLHQIGARYTVSPADLDEDPLPDEDPRDYVVRVAADKARAVAASHPASVVLAADTDVVVDGAILGKPPGADAARAMLRRLAGRPHEVHTGLAAIDTAGPPGAVPDPVTALVSTTVWFTDLDDRAIEWYVATGEPLDKAGAYGIQGAGGLFVERLEGSYHNVVGLPLAELDRLLARLGRRLLDWTNHTRPRD
jgi:septum formation protein